MKARLARNWKELLFFPFLMLLITFCVKEGSDTPPAPDDLAAGGICVNSTPYTMTHPSIACPALPDAPQIYNPNPAPNSSKPLKVTHENFLNFAWKSFVALNWPANTTAINSTWNYRGFPAVGENIATAAPDATTVWETWKEKREIFYFGNVTANQIDPNPPAPRDWNHPFDYWNAPQDVDPCPGSEDAVAQHLASNPNPRMFLQAGKASLDEAVEVPSQGQFNITDKIAQPQVFKFEGGAFIPVLYEVKLNYDYFDYVKTNELYSDYKKYNTSTSQPPPNQRVPPNPDSMIGRSGHFGANIKTRIAFPSRCIDVPGSPNCSHQNRVAYNVTQAVHQLSPSGGASATPVRTGTIQTKSGWIQTDALGSMDLNTFHKAEALFYRKFEPFDPSPKICIDHSEFALIGFHIIQKTAQQGFFIYATWEHKGLESLGLSLTNYYRGKGDSTYTPGETLPVQREPDRILASTKEINQVYHGLLGASVWTNYDLIGAQFVPVDLNALNPSCASEEHPGADCNVPKRGGAPVVPGQPTYLANLVIETNWGLQNFQGLPPGQPDGNFPYPPPYNPTVPYKTAYNTTSFPNGKYPDHPQFVFDRTLTNLGRGRNIANNTTNPDDPSTYGGMFNMGGCMGCHGVAQANGADFSFVLLFGQEGAKPEASNATPDPIG